MFGKKKIGLSGAEPKSVLPVPSRHSSGGLSVSLPCSDVDSAEPKAKPREAPPPAPEAVWSLRHAAKTPDLALLLFFFCTNSTTSPKIIHTWRVLENGCVGTWGLDSLIYDFHASFLRQISLVLKLFQFIGSFWDIVSDLYDHLPQNFKGFFYFESPILGCHTTRDVFVLGVTADTLSLAILRTFTTRIFASRPLHCNINSALFRLITR